MNHSSDKRGSLKVAAVARRTGVSVRTLHYYEEIGLLSPSGRTASGHRLYNEREIHRLQQIRSLQGLGMELSEIATCFERGEIDARRVLGEHLKRVQSEKRALEQLESLLQKTLEMLEQGGHEDTSTTESFLETLEIITMLDKYFTPEQQKRLAEHEARGTDTVKVVIADLQTAMDSGVAVQSPEARTLVQRWNEALDEVTGGDQAMIESIHTLLHSEQQAREQHGISEPLFAYMAQVIGGGEHDGS